MQREYHGWFSSRLGREMGVVAYGHWGLPLLAFPTSGGDEWELENQGMIAALADFIDAGRVKIFTMRALAGESLLNRQVHPLHRRIAAALIADEQEERVRIGGPEHDLVGREVHRR